MTSSTHHQQRLIPIYERRAENNHKQRSGSQKCAKRQFVIATLPPRQNKRDAPHAAEQRPRQNRQQRAFRAEKCPGHQHHFYVAQAHAFAPAQFEIRPDTSHNRPLPTAAPSSASISESTGAGGGYSNK